MSVKTTRERIQKRREARKDLYDTRVKARTQINEEPALFAGPQTRLPGDAQAWVRITDESGATRGYAYGNTAEQIAEDAVVRGETIRAQIEAEQAAAAAVAAEQVAGTEAAHAALVKAFKANTNGGKRPEQKAIKEEETV